MLCTGGAGFVGTHLVQKLRDLGAQVSITDSRVDVTKDVRYLEDLKRTIKTNKISVVIHLAAQAIVNTANKSPVPTFDTNVRGTWTLLEACRLSSSVESITIASSDKCYGEPQYVPIAEGHPLLALNPYDTSKALEDILARSYAKTFGMPIVVSRCSNIYGGGDKHMTRIVPGTIMSVLKGEPPVIRSDGSPRRDYLYVDDAVECYLRLGENAGRFKGEAFNFGTGRSCTVLKLTREIIRLCDSKLEPKILNVEKNFIKRQYLDSSKAQKLLGWQAKVSLEDGLRRTISAYRNQMLMAPAVHPGKRRPIWPY